jgi:hypothetical protein
LPEPVFMITLHDGSPAVRRMLAAALRFLLWMVPSCAADYTLATADGGRHALWLTLAAAFTVLAAAVLLVNVDDDSDGGKP